MASLRAQSDPNWNPYDPEPDYQDSTSDPTDGDNFPASNAPAPPQQSQAPTTASGTPDPNSNGGPVSAPTDASAQSPRERQPDIPFPVNAPRTPTPPSAEAQLGGQMNAQGGISAPGGGAQQTPQMPDSPSPIAAGPPAPFTPLPQPSPSSLVSSASSFSPASSAAVFGSSPTTQPLFGAAGGLLGGGIGLPGGDKGPLTNPTGNGDLLTSLLALLAQGGQP